MSFFLNSNASAIKSDPAHYVFVLMWSVSLNPLKGMHPDHEISSRAILMVESSERSRKKVFRGGHVQNEPPNAPQPPHQGQAEQRNSDSSTKGSPGDDSADRGSPVGERHSQREHKRASMSSHSVSARSGLQAFDERTSSVGLTQQVCEPYVPHVYARI